MLTPEQQQQIIDSIEKHCQSKKPWLGSWWGKTPDPLLDEKWVNASFNNDEQKTYVRAFFTDEPHKKSIKRYFDKGNILFNVLYNIFRVLQVVTGWIFGWGEDLFLKKVKNDFSRFITGDQKAQADNKQEADAAAAKLKQDLELDRQKKEAEAAAKLKAAEEAAAKMKQELERKQKEAEAEAKRQAQLEMEKKREEDRKRQEELERQEKQNNDNLPGFDDKAFADVPQSRKIEDEMLLVTMGSFLTFAEEMYRDEVGRAKEFEKYYDRIVEQRIQERIKKAEELGLDGFLDNEGFISQDFLTDESRREIYYKGAANDEAKSKVILAIPKIPAFNDFLKEQGRKIEIEEFEVREKRRGILDDAYFNNLNKEIEKMRSSLRDHDFTSFIESANWFYLIMMNSPDVAELQKMLFQTSGKSEYDPQEKIAAATLNVLLGWMEKSRIWNNCRAALAAYESYVLSFPLDAKDKNIIDLKDKIASMEVTIKLAKEVADNEKKIAELQKKLELQPFRAFNKVKGPLLRMGVSQKRITLDNNDNLTFFSTKEEPITLLEFIVQAKNFFDMMIKSKIEEMMKKQEKEIKNVNEEIKLDSEAVQVTQEELDNRERLRVEDNARRSCKEKLANFLKALDADVAKVETIQARYLRPPQDSKDDDLRKNLAKILQEFGSIEKYFSKEKLSSLGLDQIDQFSKEMESVQGQIQAIGIDFNRKDGVTKRRVLSSVEANRILKAIEDMGIAKWLDENLSEPGSPSRPKIS